MSVVKGTVHLAVAGLALMALACGAGSKPMDPALVRQGQEVYSEQGCTACHGRRGEGGKTAPPLEGVRRHWTHDELVRFLADPHRFKESSSRLRDLARKYPSEMPPFAIAGKERLRAVAAYVLTL